MPARRRVLYVSNNHPEIYVGGAEVYAYDLYKAMREAGEFEPIFLARSISSGHRGHRDTPFYAQGDDPNQILWSQPSHDYFFLSSPDKEEYTVHFDRLLKAYRPHVVHFQHTIGLGIDMIRQVKRSLPGTPVLYTLHEFLPICHAKGLLLRTAGGELCRQATPARCHECFPEISPYRFFLRERLMRSQLRHVDLFLAPSLQLRERYLDWGIPADKIRFEEYGRVDRGGVDDGEVPPIGHFGFFGQLRPHKGVVVLLQAMKLLQDEGAGLHLFLNGANLETEAEDFRDAVAALLADCDNVTFLGRYEPAQIAERMRHLAWVVVPSLWWENSPLVIQEAFMNRRPVICSNIGGMAEKVADGVDGLHFRVGDAADLAAKLKLAASSQERWQRYRDAIRPIYGIAETVAAHGEIYNTLLARGVGR